MNRTQDGSGPSARSGGLEGFWRPWLEQARKQPYLMALMVGSLLLSFASFFTTFAGMLNFMPVWLITFCIVFAVQALLFVTSWRIGFAFADRERLPVFTSFVFLICLSTSVFFSWVALFERINDADIQARTRETRMHRAVEDTVTELQTRMREAQRREMQALLASPEFAGWSTQIDQVAQRALESRQALESALRQSAMRNAARIEELRQERAGLRAKGAASEERRATLERTLADLESQRPTLLEKLAELRAAHAAAAEKVVIQKGLMDAEENGGASGGGRGRGPVWRELSDRHNILVAERDAQARLVEQQRQRIAEADKAFLDARAAIAGLDADVASARLTVIDQLIEREQGGGGAVSQGGGVEAATAAMRSDLQMAASRLDLAPLDSAAARCGELLHTLRQLPDGAARAAGLGCDPTMLSGALTPIRLRDQAQKSLAARCVAGGAETPTVASLSFEQARDFGRSCVDLSGLPTTEVADLRGEIARLELEEAPDASAFIKTVNAWKAGDKLAYFALAIALFIDLLVLFSGLIGAMSGAAAMSEHFGWRFSRRKTDNLRRALNLRLDADSAGDPQQWTTRAILRNAAPYLGDDKTLRGYSAEIDLDALDDPKLKGAIRQVMLGLYDDKLVRPDPERPGLHFFLKANVLDALRHHLVEDDGASAIPRAAYAPSPRTATEPPAPAVVEPEAARTSAESAVVIDFRSRDVFSPAEAQPCVNHYFGAVDAKLKGFVVDEGKARAKVAAAKSIRVRAAGDQNR